MVEHFGETVPVDYPATEICSNNPVSDLVQERRLECNLPLRPLVFSQIVANAKDLDNVPLIVLDRPMGPGNPDDFTVGPNVLHYVGRIAIRVLLKALNYLFQVAGGRIIIRQDGLVHIVPQDLLLRITEEPQAESVDELNASSRIDPDDDAA